MNIIELDLFFTFKFIIMVILGSQFGDEGKGLMTSYMTQKIIEAGRTPLVVRFNGGNQAGHTVVHNDKRHVFSNFGSGTLQGANTYWSEFCPFSPFSFLNERAALNPIHKPYVHALCPVVTPYDIFQNREEEKSNKHGSVGVGFGATIKRHEAYYKLYVKDFLYEKILIAKLKNISDYYKKWLDIDNYIMAVREVKEYIQIVDVDNEESILTKYKLIFEGAQGILLDQDFGFFPNVTRSNTTSKNALSILTKNDITWQSEDDIFYVTRTYQTRHGNGFMTNEDIEIPLELKNIENETNVFNKYQGNFRKSFLDIDLLNYSIGCDTFSKGRKFLVITCVDQTGEDFFVTLNGVLRKINIEDLRKYLNFEFEEVYISRGPSHTDIEKIYNRWDTKHWINNPIKIL